MTAGPVRVWPRQALEAGRDGPVAHPWRLVQVDGVTHDLFTDDEFAAHFVPADRLDRLLAAVERECYSHTYTGEEPCDCSLCAAWRDYRGDE
jgi:surfactin synthase thioesterase subunit